ncbi:O-antigen ligase family protein [Deinococcus rubellus]|uniref:O-antigen ligase-related domain-containing protein n=1 Tax=Deinococcus rubellus TaxID=1889240 RepID=A0ABY5YFE0_9DEIO|nr:O-antigen ligase family protein [Deinococcus rubellus]UWX63112.1 hypothetical protein N0D28_10105 [Deinococcus rubellus]
MIGIFLLLGERIIFLYNGNAVLVLQWLITILALLTVFRTNKFSKPEGFYYWTIYALCVLFYLCISTFFSQVSVGVIYGFTQVIFPIFFYILVNHSYNLSKSENLTKVIVFVAILHAIWSSIQVFYKLPENAPSIFRELLIWDKNIQALYSSSYVLYGRGTGGFINPNELGLWAALCLCWGIYERKSFYKNALITSSVISLINSQSRGSVSAVLVILVLLLIKKILDSKNFRITNRAFYLIALSILTSILVLAYSQFAIIIKDLGDYVGFDRYGSAASILTTGVNADLSFETRTQVWDEIVRYVNARPFGTLSPPQTVVSFAPDNQYMYNYLQGGIFLLILSTIPLIVWSKNLYIWMFQRNKDRNAVLGLMTVVLIVNSVSATPYQYTSFTLFWMFLAIQRNVGDRSLS